MAGLALWLLLWLQDAPQQQPSGREREGVQARASPFVRGKGGVPGVCAFTIGEFKAEAWN